MLKFNVSAIDVLDELFVSVRCAIHLLFVSFYTSHQRRDECDDNFMTPIVIDSVVAGEFAGCLSGNDSGISVILFRPKSGHMFSKILLNVCIDTRNVFLNLASENVVQANIHAPAMISTDSAYVMIDYLVMRFEPRKDSNK